MVKGSENLGHIVVMKNLFTSNSILTELLFVGIYGTQTVRSNKIRLPKLMRHRNESRILKGL